MPAHPFIGHKVVYNDELASRIVCGAVRIRPNIRHFTSTGVKWEDGSVIEHVDNVILATGYKQDLTLLEGGELVKSPKLYKHMFPAELLDDGHSTLAMLGYVPVVGPHLSIVEMQSRYFFAQLCGKLVGGNSSERKDKAKFKNETKTIIPVGPN